MGVSDSFARYRELSALKDNTVGNPNKPWMGYKPFARAAPRSMQEEEEEERRQGGEWGVGGGGR